MSILTRLAITATLGVAVVAFGCQQKKSAADEGATTQADAHAGHDHAGHDHAGHEGHDHGELADQTTCPVMGGTINKELYVDKDGKRIYVCCEACIEKLKADFAKYEAKLEEMGQKAQTL
jgi:ABC-type Zn2+ transport system substrate-binding protein/surface adhesin